MNGKKDVKNFRIKRLSWFNVILRKKELIQLNNLMHSNSWSIFDWICDLWFAFVCNNWLMSLFHHFWQCRYTSDKITRFRFEYANKFIIRNETSWCLNIPMRNCWFFHHAHTQLHELNAREKIFNRNEFWQNKSRRFCVYFYQPW